MVVIPPSRIFKRNGKAEMVQYIIRRIFLSIPVLIGILLVTFALARLIPGDPVGQFWVRRPLLKSVTDLFEKRDLINPSLCSSVFM